MSEIFFCREYILLFDDIYSQTQTSLSSFEERFRMHN